jgi:hypothetical protein
MKTLIVLFIGFVLGLYFNDCVACVREPSRIHIIDQNPAKVPAKGSKVHSNSSPMIKFGDGQTGESI